MKRREGIYVTKDQEAWETDSLHQIADCQVYTEQEDILSKSSAQYNLQDGSRPSGGWQNGSWQIWTRRRRQISQFLR